MKLKFLAGAFALIAAALIVSLPATAQGPGKGAKSGSKLTLKVMTAGDKGYATTSTIISGQRDAIIIDPQFARSEAKKVATAVKASGKNLTIVYSTHGHPDHYFGLATLREEFPDAMFRALPEVVPNIERGWPARREFWYPTYGDELPSAKPVLPQGLGRPAGAAQADRGLEGGELGQGAVPEVAAKRRGAWRVRHCRSSGQRKAKVLLLPRGQLRAGALRPVLTTTQTSRKTGARATPALQGGDPRAAAKTPFWHRRDGPVRVGSASIAFLDGSRFAKHHRDRGSQNRR